jgi:H+/Cl- antiporter ClcA
MYEPAGCSMRSKALVALAMYGATVVVTVLLFTSPPPSASDDLALPFLLFPSILLGLFTSAVTLYLGVASCVTSFKIHRWGWASAFVVLTLLCVLGPVVLYIGFNWQPPTAVGSPQWTSIAVLLASGPLLTLVAILFSPARSALD